MAISGQMDACSVETVQQLIPDPNLMAMADEITMCRSGNL